MKRTISPLAALLLCGLLNAQNLPVQTVTLFKNGKSLLFKAGSVPTSDSKYSTRDLPDALFGTYWVSSPTGEITSVFAVEDSVERTLEATSNFTLLERNISKSVRLVVGYGDQTEVVEGTIEKVMNAYGSGEAVIIQAGNKWLSLEESQIRRVEFLAKPNFDKKTKVTDHRLDVNFKDKKPQQDLGLIYLTENIGWTPVYRLDLTEKNKGKLSLRAELANDAEDLGSPELHLAVAVPNFARATKKSVLLNFKEKIREYASSQYSYDLHSRLSVPAAAYYNIDFGDDDEPATYQTAGANFEGAQLEDYYYYTIKPGNFPKNSRFQYPVFEEEIQPEHFYECRIEDAATGGKSIYSKPREDYPVTHYIEFLNKAKYPWTEGTVSILSKPIVQSTEAGTRKELAELLAKFGGDLQPVSQDLLPYTPANEKCKVRIAQAPDIKVTHVEGDVSRTEKAKKFFNQNYDLVKVESQLGVVNRGTETVTLKIRRNIEGNPLDSDQKWTKKQELATLQVNSTYTVEWELELKPGEEKKWKYAYEVFVNTGGLDKD